MSLVGVVSWLSNNAETKSGFKSKSASHPVYLFDERREKRKKKILDKKWSGENENSSQQDVDKKLIW